MPRRRIFVSYHSPDRGTAKRLATALRAHDLEVFLDTWTLQPGAFWTPALAEGLADADAVLLLLGRNSPGPWQTLEYYEALDRKARQPDFPVVPVVLGDTRPRLPFLGQLHWLQLADPAAEPALARLLPALRGEPLSPVAEPWRVLNPYRGLLALTEADADYFFGRDTLTADILDRLHRGERGLMLVGNSGVGKSSLVQAGVIAALRRQRWPGDPGRPWPPDLRDSRSWLFLTMRPGDQPLYELARAFVGQWTEPTDPARGALARSWEDSLGGGLGLRELLRATTDQLAERSGGAPPRRFVLVVDQAEELYTRADAAQARRFSASLAEAAQQPGVLVLASLRADHYGRLQEDTPLYRAAVRIDVPPLREEGRCEEERCDNGLCAVIGAPARVLGARFEHDTMVLRLAAATAGEPGALPLLSYLLEDMWAEMQKRGDGVLRWADYARLGELRSVLSRRAEAYRERCAAEQRRTLMRLFTLRLAHVPAEGEVVRRRAHRGECSAAEWAMAEELAGPDWRLLVIGDGAGRPAAAGTGQPTAEVAHEVLLRRWERLAGWLTEQRGFLEWKGQFEQDRKAWQQGGRRDGNLLRERPLDRALDWQARRGDDLSGDDRAFIRASLAWRERQRRRFTLGALAGATVLTVLLAVALWFAYDANRQRIAVDQQRIEAEQQRSEADRQRNAAQAQRDEALRTQSRFLADLSFQQTEAGDATNGILLALEGLPRDLADPDRPFVAEAEEALFVAVLAHREKRVLRGHSAAFSPDGQRVVTASSDGTAGLWDAGSGQLQAVLRGHQESVNSAVFSADGQRVVTTSWDGTARLWDAESGQPQAVLRGHVGPVWSAVFSADGQRVVTASLDGTARLWDAGSGQPQAVLRGHQRPVESAALSADGQRVVTASDDRTARLWDTASAHSLAILRGHEGIVWSAAFSADGQRVVTASDDRTARIWRLPPSGTALLACARRMVPRQLTPAQRRQFFLDDAASDEALSLAEPAGPAGDCLADGDRPDPAGSPHGVAAAPAADPPSAGRR